MINFKKMMEQAQQVQFKLQEMQERLKEIDVSGESGGGLVKAVMSCAGVVKSLSIDPSLISADDKETLEDLVIAAVNSASEAKEARVQEESRKMMESAGINPDGSNLPF